MAKKAAKKTAQTSALQEALKTAPKNGALHKALKNGAVEAGPFLEKLVGPLTFGSMVRSVRETDDYTLASFAKKLGVSRQFICDVEHGRRSVPPKTAARWARALGYSESLWVEYALQAEVDAAGLKYRVRVEAA